MNALLGQQRELDMIARVPAKVVELVKASAHWAQMGGVVEDMSAAFMNVYPTRGSVRATEQLVEGTLIGTLDEELTGHHGPHR